MVVAHDSISLVAGTCGAVAGRVARLSGADTVEVGYIGVGSATRATL